MTATIIVLYPSGHDFDLDYYLKTHMPLVSSIWTSFGLQGWEISKFADGPYQIQAVLKWDNSDSVAKGLASSGAQEILGDIKNFTTAEAVIMTGDIVGSG